jgi:hypothetical protein
VRLTAILFLFSAAAWAQAPAPPTTPSNPDAPGELDKLKQTCFSKFTSCFQELFTGDPFHIAVGSIAPQDGFGGGLAYSGHVTPTNWRITWSGDGIVSNDASWRVGFYMTLVHTPMTEKDIGIKFGTKNVKPNLTGLPEHSVINIYEQTISLNKVTYFGLGASTTEAGRSFFGMTETILGVRGVKPLPTRVAASVYGEVNGRFVDIRGSSGQPSPSIGQLYTDASAPGLTSQPGFLQLGQGFRMRPVLFNDYVRLNYDVALREYLAPGNSHYSFERLNVDLNHQFAIYKDTRFLVPRDSNTTDTCAVTTDSKNCAQVTRNSEGSVNLRAWLNLSMTPGGDVVPFYFQPTLGGSDLNGNQSLTSYQDYRFRAPNELLFEQSFEHSIYGPLGLTFGIDEGTLSMTRGSLLSSTWRHSFSAGLTLRAGGLPVVALLFSWGGGEGTHTIANVNTSLLGGSSRPMLQ